MSKSNCSGASVWISSDDDDVSMDVLRARAIAAVERIRELNRDADPDQVMADVTAIVGEVRQERYEAEQAAKSSSHH
jgi:hypothetical protein